jgi:hypothetical protein
MVFHKVIIFQRVFAGLSDDESPVFEWMGKLSQKGIHALGQAVIFGHNLLQRSILFIYADIDVVFGKIDLEGFGFYLQEFVLYFGFRGSSFNGSKGKKLKV